MGVNFIVGPDSEVVGTGIRVEIPLEGHLRPSVIWRDQEFKGADILLLSFEEETKGFLRPSSLPSSRRRFTTRRRPLTDRNQTTCPTVRIIGF